MVKPSVSPAPSWLVVGDRSPYAALEGLTLESGMASTSSTPAFGLYGPGTPRFLLHCLPPSTGMLFPKESGICLHLLSSSDGFSPLSNVVGGAVEMLNLGRTAPSLEFMLAHVQ